MKEEIRGEAVMVSKKKLISVYQDSDTVCSFDPSHLILFRILALEHLIGFCEDLSLRL